jgi:hypothetical protein
MSTVKILELRNGSLIKTNSIERFLTITELQEIIECCKNQIKGYKENGVTESEIYKMNRDLLVDEITDLSNRIEVNKHLSAKIYMK